jgi:hypothetical protein
MEHLNNNLLFNAAEMQLGLDLTPPSTPSHHDLNPRHPVHAETAYGYLADINDALLIVQLCMNDKMPLVRRRLTLFERENIRSGSIFSFIETNEKSNPIVTPPRKSKDLQPMRRWTDGLSWSKSRVHGHFLVYKEVAEKRSVSAKRAAFDDDAYNRNRNGKATTILKSDGLMKRTFSIIVDGNIWHVVCFFTSLLNFLDQLLL